MQNCVNDRGTPIEQVPSEAEVEWAIGHAGYQTVFSTDDASQARLSADGMIEVYVDMDPGWSVRIDIVDENRLGVYGVDVVADELVVGTTDQIGHAEVRCRTRPRSIELRGPDLTFSPSPDVLFALDRSLWKITAASSDKQK